MFSLFKNNLMLQKLMAYLQMGHAERTRHRQHPLVRLGKPYLVTLRRIGRDKWKKLRRPYQCQRVWPAAVAKDLRNDARRRAMKRYVGPFFPRNKRFA